MGQCRLTACAVATIVLATGCEFPTLKRESPDSAFGGTVAIQSEPTGFFRVAQAQGRWWLITPDGRGFLSAGVNHVDYNEDRSSEAVHFVSEHLRDWGFNTIGWSQELLSEFGAGPVKHSRGWGPRQYAEARMPYTHLLRFTDIEWYVEAEFPDVFGDQFAAHCDRVARETCAQLRNDPLLVGYFYSDAPNWPLWAQQVGRDRIDEVARQYYNVIANSIRRYDPNHLLLGDRYKADRSIPLDGGRVSGVLPEVVAAAAESIDILSLEYYRPGNSFDDDLDRWHRLTGKPILLADSAYLAPTDVLHPSPDSPSYVPDQRARGEAYQRFGRRAYAKPMVIGWHWCALGRSRGRQSGLLDGDDRPYKDAVDRMRQFNLEELYQVGLSAARDAPADMRRDRFGGTVVQDARASGYFRLEFLDGRWWFVDPAGYGFLSAGINHLDLAALNHPDNIGVFEERYGGSEERLIEEGIARRLRSWGFNTIGWSQELVGGVWGKDGSVIRHSQEWSRRQFERAGLPYVYNLAFAEIESFNALAHFPDVFDPEFEEWADYLARSRCADKADDPLLIGYADVAVPDFTSTAPGAWAEELDLAHEPDRLKLENILRRYFEVTTRAILRYDPNHLIFGPRFRAPPHTPEWIIALSGEYFDAILVNNFVGIDQLDSDLARWYELSGKPILISDMLYLAPTEILSPSPQSQAYVPDQAARGKAYRQFAQVAFRQPFVVGLHWCAFLENRTRKSGIVDRFDNPYYDAVEPMRRFNRFELYSTALGSKQ